MISIHHTTSHLPPRLELRRVGKHFSGIHALDDVSLTLKAGEVHALAGENGAGKSTLIKILAGAHERDAGDLYLDGKLFSPKSPLDSMHAGIRVVHQELHMLDQLSIAENLMFESLPRKFLGIIDKTVLNHRARELLTLVGLDDLDPTTLVVGLGMAQRQLIEIAKALANESRVVVMDEPTATLTSRETERLFEIIRRLRVSGVAVLFVSHHLEELFTICDQVTVLRNGRWVATRPIAQTSADDIVQLMVGRAIDSVRIPVNNANKPNVAPALSVAGLRYIRQPQGAEINFDLHKGEILGLGGLVGSGRTEIVRAIFGADPKAAGEVFRNGCKALISSPRDAINQGICLVTEDRKDEGLMLDMPVHSNVTLARIWSYARMGWVKQNCASKDTLTMVKSLDIRLASIEQTPRELSGGNQQKVVLAKWLLERPEVLILDEPTRGVDVGAKAEIHNRLREMAKHGMAILVVSSDLPELMQLCDRIIVLSRGQLAGEIDRPQFSEQIILRMAYSEYLKNQKECNESTNSHE